jgi:hypothetical protein
MVKLKSLLLKFEFYDDVLVSVAGDDARPPADSCYRLSDVCMSNAPTVMGLNIRHFYKVIKLKYFSPEL